MMIDKEDKELLHHKKTTVDDPDEVSVTYGGGDDTQPATGADFGEQQSPPPPPPPAGDKREEEEEEGDLAALVHEQGLQIKEYKDKLQRSLADYQNLQKRTETNIQTQLNIRMDRLFADFLQIYDDFKRAKSAFEADGVDTKGLNSILRNMDSLMSQNNLIPIEALGEMFDPNMHEAISMVPDDTLDDGTVVKEIRTGYRSHNRVIRPTLVEISKKQVTT